MFTHARSSIAVDRMINRFLDDPDKPPIIAIARPVTKKNLIAMVEAFGQSPELQNRANLVIIAGSRTARELLANIHKHAGATTVRVGLSRRGDRVVLTVDDNGKGFDPAVVEQYVADGHIGLGSLLARFDAMGGSMRIESSPGQGMQVIAISPPEPALSHPESLVEQT